MVAVGPDNVVSTIDIFPHDPFDIRNCDAFGIGRVHSKVGFNGCQAEIGQGIVIGIGDDTRENGSQFVFRCWSSRGLAGALTGAAQADRNEIIMTTLMKARNCFIGLP